MIRIVMAVICLATIMGVSGARAENPTQIAFSCAPWDGRSLEITVGAPDVTYHIALWSGGIAALNAGTKSLMIDDSMKSDGMGMGRICSGMQRDRGKCRSEALQLEINAADVKVGGTISGAIKFKGMAVPFSGVVASEQSFCG